MVKTNFYLCLQQTYKLHKEQILGSVWVFIITYREKFLKSLGEPLVILWSWWRGAFFLYLLKQVTQAGRTQLVKPGTVVAGTSGVMATGKAITRTVTDREVAALLKQQQLNKSGQVTQVQ